MRNQHQKHHSRLPRITVNRIAGTWKSHSYSGSALIVLSTNGLRYFATNLLPLIYLSSNTPNGRCLTFRTFTQTAPVPRMISNFRSKPDKFFQLCRQARIDSRSGDQFNRNAIWFLFQKYFCCSELWGFCEDWFPIRQHLLSNRKHIDLLIKL